MHFITNHDENSWNGTEFERMGEAFKAFAILAMTFDGIPLIYSGQEEPLTRRLQFFEKDNIKFSEYKEMVFYKQLIELKKQQKALWTEPYGARLEKIGEKQQSFCIQTRERG